jgi:predicted nucleotidyltransferase
MKQLPSHIPSNKQKELNQIVDIIKKSIETDMIILFGSYAR